MACKKKIENISKEISNCLYTMYEFDPLIHVSFFCDRYDMIHAVMPLFRDPSLATNYSLHTFRSFSSFFF